MGLDMYIFKKKKLSATEPKFDWDAIHNAPNPAEAYYESTKHEQVWEVQTVREWEEEQTLHNYFCRFARIGSAHTPLRITKHIALLLLMDIHYVLEDNSKAKTIFSTKEAKSNLYGCDKNYYKDKNNFDRFIKTLTNLKPLVEQILKDQESADEIYYEYDCRY